jgi:hypothetical protein
LSELNERLASDKESVAAMLAITSVVFGVEDWTTGSSLLLVQSCGRYLFNLAKDFRVFRRRYLTASKIATPVSFIEGHTNSALRQMIGCGNARR